MSKAILQGIKVLEYGQMVSAPFCAKLLAHLGAEVIKVESPQGGDRARRRGPFAGDEPHPERSALYYYLNTSKRSITLNLETETGKDIFYRLLAGADFFVENNPPQYMVDLELDYERLSQLNPRLIMVSVTPFGQTGPYRDLKGTDLICFHAGGLGYVSPRFRQRAEEEPLRISGHVADFTAGLHGALGALCALYARGSSGSGQLVDVSGQEAILSMVPIQVAVYGFNRTVWTRVSRSTLAPFHFYPCRDGYVFVMCPEPHQWQRLVELMGNPDWAKDDLFYDNPGRSEYWDAIGPLLADWIKDFTMEEIYRLANAHRIPCAPANTPADLVRSKHLAARGFFVETEHPEMGIVKYPGAPGIFSGTPWDPGTRAPLLGEHNEEIYCRRLGFGKEDLVKLRQAQII